MRTVAVVLVTGLAVTWWTDVWPFGPKRVRICRGDGRPIHGAVLLLRRPGEREPDFRGRTSTSSGWLAIPRERIRDGAEMLVVAPGCGLRRGELPWGFRVALPEPVRATLRVGGDFALPRRPERLRLRLEPVDAEPGLGRALEEAVAPRDYWRREEMDRDRDIFVDPESRSVVALLPRGGRWQVRWSVVVTERRGAAVMTSGTGPDEGVVVEVPEGGGTVAVPIEERALAEHRQR